MKVLKFTTTIPVEFRDLSYTEAVLAIKPDWSFYETIGTLLNSEKIQGFIRNINETFFVESFYFINDDDFEFVKIHISCHLKIFDESPMPFVMYDNLNFNQDDITNLIINSTQEIQIINPKQFHFLNK